MLDWLFGAATFLPHGVCMLWRPDLVAMHVVSDALIALAYFAIPWGIAWFVKRRDDLTVEHKRVAILFAIFISACGVTHLLGIVTLWSPIYGVQAIVKAVTAFVSVLTALAIWPLLPRLLALPSPGRLQQEIAAKEGAVAALESTRRDLERLVEERTQDLHEVNRRFEAALAGSTTTVFEQDANLAYTWIYNPSFGRSPEDYVGRTDAEMFGPAASAVEPVKRRALAEGAAVREEVALAQNGEQRWYDLKVEPLTLRDGRPGIISTAAEITAQKRQQEQLELVMRELNHRSKNLLAMVQSIARQSAPGLRVPKEFFERLERRLRALAHAHDLIVARDWKGADLHAVVSGQLEHQLDAARERVRIDGEPVALDPDAAQYLALAVHELGANAVKHGALSSPWGGVDIGWRVEAGAGGARRLKLDWRERGGPSPGETGGGFGRLLLEKLLPRALKGESVLSFEPEGLVWTLDVPLGVD